MHIIENLKPEQAGKTTWLFSSLASDEPSLPLSALLMSKLNNQSLNLEG